ncbi:hypothetical protein WOC23_23085 [Vibrio parahaemolyticus]
MSILTTENISLIATGFAVASIANLIYPLLKGLVERELDRRRALLRAKVVLKILDEHGKEKKLEIGTGGDGNRIDEKEIRRIIELLEEKGDASKKSS